MLNHSTEPLLTIEKHFLEHQLEIEAWFHQAWKKTQPPFYGSVDLRNAGFKLAPVDTNLFPAGFNNLNREFLPLCVQAVQSTLAEICPQAEQLLIIPESHTRNRFYFESLETLVDIIKRAGFSVKVANLESIQRKNNKIGVDDFFPGCIILNNDLSSGAPDILKNLDQQIIFPSIELGWSTRLKSDHFREYTKVCDEFSELVKLDSWLFNPYFDQCAQVDFMQPSGGCDCLIEQSEALLNKIRKKYEEFGIKEKPFLIIKADAGTYGMAVMTVYDPQELKTLNRKQRTRMSTIKGGKPVTKVIIQEGVYTFERVGEEQAVAEPVVYAIGSYVVGGFYRVNKDRGVTENLNAPGMNFESLAFASSYASPQFYAYGVIARLALLAAARE